MPIPRPFQGTITTDVRDSVPDSDTFSPRFDSRRLHHYFVTADTYGVRPMNARSWVCTSASSGTWTRGPY